MDKLSVFSSLEKYKKELQDEIEKAKKEQEQNPERETPESYEDVINSYRSHIKMIDVLISRL